jgi:CheY-like chemotaxis protein
MGMALRPVCRTPQEKGRSAMKARVLVIDDHPINLELATAMLEGMGCEIVAASTPECGLVCAGTERVDLVLMDVQLPGMTGYEATRRLKADPRTADIPVVAVTAHALKGEEERARAAGCDAYLPKPLDYRSFERTVRRFIGNLEGGDRGEAAGGPTAGNDDTTPTARKTS